MRKLLYLALIMLVSVAWAAAQDASVPGSAGQSQSGAGSSAPGSMPGQTPSTMPGQTPSTMPGQTQAPGAPDASSQTAGDNQIVEGCLGGSAPNFTVTDKAGTSYKLDVPKDAEATLTRHVGESVKVAGTMSGGSSAGSSASGSKTIQVVQMGRGTSTCPASGSSSTGTSGTSGTSNPGTSGTSNSGSSAGSSSTGNSTTPAPKK